MVISSTTVYRNYKDLIRFEKYLATNVALDFKSQIRIYYRDGKLGTLDEIQNVVGKCHLSM